MSDLVDIANDAVETALADAVRRQIGKSAPTYSEDFDGEHCVDCETEIPPARLALGKETCVDCQRLRERHAQPRL